MSSTKSGAIKIAEKCRRCDQEISYGCDCTVYELSDWLANRVTKLESALVEIDRLESNSYSLRDADMNFKECGRIARETLL